MKLYICTQVIKVNHRQANVEDGVVNVLHIDGSNSTKKR